jgi:enterochelin esterase-like enzyme
MLTHPCSGGLANPMTYVRAFDHESELLVGNAWGDPHQRKVHVYLPPGYSDRRKDPYPVVFLLAGWSGRGAHYLMDQGAFGQNLAQRLDSRMEKGAMPEAIVVFPDGSSRLGASQYVNSSVNGPHMDYLCDELVDWVDTRFHTHASRDYRGIIGHSSGGFGALACGMMRSDRFGSICSSAGDCWYEYLYTHTIPLTIQTLNAAGGVGPFVDKWLASPNPMGLMGHAAIITMLNLSMCCCYMPNPHVPHIKGDLWFDLETGALIDDVFTRFKAWDPLYMLDHHVTELKSLRWIHLEAGTEDEYGLNLGHRQLATKLRKHGIEFQLDEYPGKHGGHHHRMLERIACMLRAMDAP